jgi:hypothetical protein
LVAELLYRQVLAEPELLHQEPADLLQYQVLLVELELLAV